MVTTSIRQESQRIVRVYDGLLKRCQHILYACMRDIDDGIAIVMTHVIF